MKRNLLVILALLLGMTTLQAKPVEISTAQRLGLNFIQHKAMFAKTAVNELDLAYTFRATNGMATAYVFNFAGGYVVVAADDSYSPILGYSDQGQFDYDNAPDGLSFMLGELSNDIEKTVQLGRPVPSDILCRWKNLDAYGKMHPDRRQVVVEPLVQQRWNQDSPFNMYAPGGCPTGCVATAMAQIMKYWEWPVQGTGEHSYVAMGYGEQYANFGATTYDWDNMIDNYNYGSTQEQKVAVATLMYHCGVSVDMMYEPSGSGAFSPDVPVAISNYFSIKGSVPCFLLFIVLLIVSTIAEILKLYAAMCLGQSLSEHRIAASIGIYVGFNILESIFESVIIMISGITQLSASDSWFNGFYPAISDTGAISSRSLE